MLTTIRILINEAKRMLDRELAIPQSTPRSGSHAGFTWHVSELESRCMLEGNEWDVDNSDNLGELSTTSLGHSHHETVSVQSRVGRRSTSFSAIQPSGMREDDQTSIGYNCNTGELFLDAPEGVALTSINIDSTSGIFTGDPAMNLGGSFDNDSDNNIFKATFGGSFGSQTFGNVSQAGLSEDSLLADLTVVGSLAGGGDLADVDLIYVCENAGPSSIVTGDLDGDGRSDLVTGNSISNDVSVQLGNGDGTFQSQLFFRVGDRPTSIVTDDLNNDGLLDVATGNAGSRDISILLGIGDGTFQSEVRLPVDGGIPTSLALGDFNGDQLLDIAVAVDAVAPQVVQSSLVDGDIVPAFTAFEYTARFSETLSDANLDAEDIHLIGREGNKPLDIVANYDATTYTLTLEVPPLSEDEYTLTLFAGDGQFEDLAGNDLSGGNFEVSFITDLIETVPFPVPLHALAPRGSLVYEGTANGFVGPANDRDSFAINVDDGQSITVVLSPGATLQPMIQLLEPSGNVIAATQTSETGLQAVLQTVATRGSGTYTLTISGEAETTGTYSARLILNAAVEDETLGGESNDDIRSAQMIDNGFSSFVTGDAARAAVLGTVNDIDPNDVDVYGFSLDQGESATVALEPLMGGTLSLHLVDGEGKELAMSVDTRNLNHVIPNFLAPSSGTYFARVTGEQTSDYNVVVTKNADFDSEPNNNLTAQTQDITHTGTALGYLETGSLFVSVGRAEILEIEPSTGAVLSRIDTGFGVLGLAATRNHLLASRSGQFVVLDAVSADIRTLEVSGVRSWDIAFLGDEVFVLPFDFSDRLNRELGNEIIVLNVTTGEESRRIPLTVDSEFLLDVDDVGLAASAERLYLLVDYRSRGDATLIEINPGSGATRNVGMLPESSSFSGTIGGIGVAGRKLFVQGRVNVDVDPRFTSSEIEVYDLSTLESERPLTIPGEVTAIGDGVGVDDYTVQVNAGDVITINTSVPASGEGEFVNELDVAIELRDPAGHSVASSANGSLSHAANMSGIYVAQIFGDVESSGEYVIRVEGHTGMPPSFEVTATEPAAGILTSESDVTVHFTDSVRLDTLQASDLRLGSLPAQDLAIVDGDTVLFDIPDGLDGVFALEIDAGSVLDVQGQPIEAFTSTFTADTKRPRVTESFISVDNSVVAEGAPVPAGVPLMYTARFDETLNATNLDVADVRLTERSGVELSPSMFEYDADTSTLTVEFPAFNEGEYTVTLFSGDDHFEDSLGNDLADGDFEMSFVTDFESNPFPVPLQTIPPLGSLVHEGRVTGLIGPVTDRDSFTINLDGGQTMTVVLSPEATLHPMIDLSDPDGSRVGTSLASAAGQEAVLQTVAAGGAGTYTVTISGGASTTGTYSVRLIINAAVEVEAHVGSGNDDLLSAQMIDGSFISLGLVNAERAAVLGTVHAIEPNDVDIYGFSLKQGESATIAVKALTTATLRLHLLDGGGNELAASIAASNVDHVIPNFVAPVDGTYLARVSGDQESDYSLVVTKNVEFNTEPRDGLTTHAQDIAQTSTALGYVASRRRLFVGATLEDPLFRGILELDPNTGAFLNRINGRLNVGGLAATPIHVLTYNLPQEITVLDADSDTLIRTLQAPEAGNGDIAFLGDKVFVLPFDEAGDEPLSEIVVLDFATGNASRTIPLSLEPDFLVDVDEVGLAASSDSLFAVIDLLRIPQSTLFEIDPVSGATRNLGVLPESIGGFGGAGVFGQELFVGGRINFDDDFRQVISTEIAVYDLQTLEIKRRLSIPGRVISIGATEGIEDDFYTLIADSGDVLMISTALPASGTGEFLNALDVAIELFGPTGDSVARSASGILSHLAMTTGPYVVRIRAENESSGEYVLHIEGHTGMHPSFQVSTTVPADSVLTSTLTMVFTDSVRLDTLEASDLRVGSLPAQSLTVTDGTTAVFRLPNGLDGVFDLEIAAGSILDLQGQPIEPFSRTFTVTTTEVELQEPLSRGFATNDAVRRTADNELAEATELHERSSVGKTRPLSDPPHSLISAVNATAPEHIGTPHFTAAAGLKGGISPATYPPFFAAESSRQLNAGVFNADAPANTSRVSVFLGRGDGSFEPELTGGRIGEGAFSIVTGHFSDDNGDGQIGDGDFVDLATANQGSGDISVLPGTGDGGFTQEHRIFVGDGLPTSLTTADFNHNGVTDLVVANRESNSISILSFERQANGIFTFGVASTQSVGMKPVSVVTGDFNNDGLADIATANAQSNDVSVLLGLGNGTFTPQRRFAVGDGPQSAVAADFNTDAVLDLATANTQSSDLTVLLGIGDGTFEREPNDTAQTAIPLPLGTPESPQSIAARIPTSDDVDFFGVTLTEFGELSVSLVTDGGSTAALQFTLFDDTILSNVLATPLADGEVLPDGMAFISEVLHGGMYFIRVRPAGPVNSIRQYELASRFQPATVPVGRFPAAVVTSDFDGDGLLDLATANSGSDDVTVLLGQGDGTFVVQTPNYEVGEQPGSMVAADFDGDQRIDLAVANEGSNDVSILLGQRDGTFSRVGRAFPVEPRVMNSNPRSIVAGDFNKDGNLDLATANSIGSVSILVGNGRGMFRRLDSYEVPGQLSGITAEDFNADGILDLATANTDTDEISVLIGQTGGTFASAVHIPTGQGPVALVAADFDNDQDFDLAIADSTGTVSILLGLGDGTFVAASSFNLGGIPADLAVGDVFKKDGNRDIVVANSLSSDVFVLEGRGDGEFQQKSFVAAAATASITLGKFNDDDVEDLAAAHRGLNAVSVQRGGEGGTFVPVPQPGGSAPVGMQQAFLPQVPVVAFQQATSVSSFVVDSPIDVATSAASGGSGSSAASGGLSDNTAVEFRPDVPAISIQPPPLETVAPEASTSTDIGGISLPATSSPKRPNTQGLDVEESGPTPPPQKESGWLWGGLGVLATSILYGAWRLVRRPKQPEGSQLESARDVVKKS